MTELPDNVREFLTYYLALRHKAYTPCTRREADEAGNSRSSTGKRGGRTYSLVKDRVAWGLFRYIESELNRLTRRMYRYFNPKLVSYDINSNEQKLTLKVDEKKVTEG